MDRPRLELTGVVLDAPDPDALARFYERLLGWARHTDEPDWITLHDPRGGAGLSFQREEDHVRPIWPAGPGDPSACTSESSRPMLRADLGAPHRPPAVCAVAPRSAPATARRRLLRPGDGA